MVSAEGDRELVREAERRLDGWLHEARGEAHEELFEGDEAVLADAELAELDRIDSALNRGGGDGLWGTDRYGVVTSDALGSDEARVVCVYHPEIPGDGYPGAEGLRESTREAYNDVLWRYAERVAEALQDRLERFLEERAAAGEE